MVTNDLLVAAHYELVTLVSAAAGLAMALSFAMIAQIGGSLVGRAQALYQPLLVCLYALPPFATVIAATALRINVGLVPLMAAASVGLPLTLLLRNEIARAEAFGLSCQCGNSLRKFVIVYMPYIIHGILLSIATCIPWVLLAAILGEIATSTHGGMGIRLFNAMQRGWSAATPYLIVVFLTSTVLYFTLISVAGVLRKMLSLGQTSIEVHRTPAPPRLSPITEAIFLIFTFAVFWWIVHSVSPYLVPGISRAILAINSNSQLVMRSLLETTGASICALIMGGAIGFSLALIGKLAPLSRYVILILVLPLQVLPLIVFVPLLIALRLWMEDSFITSNLGMHYMWRQILPSVVPSLLVGTLASAYAFYDVGKAQLSSLPATRGTMIEARRRLDIRVLHHIDLPWLWRCAPQTFEIAMPRVVLAVLVSEILVTSYGMGGFLADQRGRSNFAEAWSALLLLLSTIIFFQFVISSTTQASVKGGVDG